MSDVVIHVEDVSKQYRLGQVGRKTLSSDVDRWWQKLRGKEDPFLKIGEENDRTAKGNSEYVWALRNINFKVKHGEVLGIIGRNGAGKSTLLKILSKVTAPTQGNIKIKGRIASLLEVGTGFHPDLSGRDNIFLNGAILGMTKKEIQNKFDEIVDFAGVERYIDTPVKRYSSGMYVRLAFAVAAHLEPDILIVDEVLAVGDAEFQKKCLGKMKDVSEKDGRTILFVSHNMAALSRLCGSCLYLKNGLVVSSGATDKIITEYLKTQNSSSFSVEYNASDAPSSNIVRLISAKVINENGEGKFNFNIDENIGVEIVFEVLQQTNDLVCGFNLYNEKDIHVLSSHDVANNGYGFNKGIFSSSVWIPKNFLAEGTHYCSVALMSYKPFTVHFNDLGKIGFNIIDKQNGKTVRGEYTGIFPGIIRPLLKWNSINNKNSAQKYE
jgi:lipopolysaccharide transport system ATP-binding protein